MTGQKPKTRGVADIVFLLDATASMTPCLEALKENVGVFIDSLAAGDPNNASPVKDWRAKVIGFRDFQHYPEHAWEEHPFSRDPEALKAHLASLEPVGSLDEPESLLDALYRVATMAASEQGAQADDPDRWRYRSEAARVVVVFTDASYHETMSIPEAQGGSVDDVINAVVTNRVILSLFAPDLACHERLSMADRCEWEVIDYPGLSPQEALAKFTSDQENFRNTLRQLAASVSKSAETLAL